MKMSMVDGGRLKLEKKFGGIYDRSLGMTDSDLIADTKVQEELRTERRNLAAGSDEEGYFQALTYARMNEQLGAVHGALKLSRTDMDLYRRRYAQGSIQIDTTNMLQDLQRSMRPVDPPGDGQQPALSRMDRKKQQRQAEKAAKSSYESAKEKVATQFANPQELSTEWFSKHVMRKEIELKKQDGTTQTTTQEGLLQQVLAGNYENLEQLDPVLRNMAAQKYMERITIDGANSTDPSELINALFNKGGVAALMNPLFRVGLSLLAKGASISQGAFAGYSAEHCAEMEDLCNQRIMSSTLYTVPKQGEGIGLNELERNKQSQIFIAKTLLAAHMGKLQRVDTNEDTKERKKSEWKGGMASAFAHCSRVAFTLPGDKKTTDAMCGEEHGLKAGFFKRTAATHKLSKKKKSKEGSELIEKKSKLGTFYGQQGMNVAVGGLGNPGVGGSGGTLRKLKNDGSCGHVYMHVDQGGDSTLTGLLVGFESDAPGVMNMTGHRHGMGNPEFASSFGGMRTDEIGDKYGGRVDLSGYDKEKFEESMKKLETRMNELYAKVEQGDEVAQAELMNISDLLAGKQMTPQQIQDLLNGVSGDFVYKGKHYKTAESCVLAKRVAEAKPEELKDPKMIAAVQQDFIENFGQLIAEQKALHPDQSIDPFELFRGNSIGSLTTINTLIRSFVPADILKKAIEAESTEETDAMHEIGEFFRRSRLQREVRDFIDHKINSSPDIEHELEQRQKGELLARPASLDRVLARIGDQIKDSEVGELLSGISKAFTDHGVSDDEFSMRMMNNLMLRTFGIIDTMKELQPKMKENGRWTKGLTPEEEKDLDLYNSMKMMQLEANTLLTLKGKALTDNPFNNAIRRRMDANAAAPQQPTN